MSESYVVVSVEWQSTQDRMYSLLSVRKLCSCVCRGAVYRRPSHIRYAPPRNLVKVKGHTSCNTYEIRYGTHVIETCHTYEWTCKTFWHSTHTCTKLAMLVKVKEHVSYKMRHDTHLSETRHTYEWVCKTFWHSTHTCAKLGMLVKVMKIESCNTRKISHGTRVHEFYLKRGDAGQKVCV